MSEANRGFGHGGRGGVESLLVSYSYVMAVSILAFITMVRTKFNNRWRVGFLIANILAFFFLPGGHLIELIPKLMGAEGVRATAGEVGVGHVETYSVLGALLILALTLGSTFFMGRAVCGYGCPVGAVQELLYDIPTGRKGENKLMIPTGAASTVRIGVLGLIVGSYLTLGIDLIREIAPYQLWRFEIVTPGLYVIISFFAASLFTYRPFCRLFCPYGAIASLTARFSQFKLTKTDSCIECGVCEMKCPTGELSEEHGECYLCGRCVRSCNLDALECTSRTSYLHKR